MKFLDFLWRVSNFLFANMAYLLWFILYFYIAWFIFGANLNSFILVSIVYGGSITLALSPIGECILRIMQNCREPSTEYEKSYLLPLFEEVYENAMELNPKINKGIKLYIMDAMYVNAFAVGRKTITVTKGAVETFTADELKGVLAHEFGHILYGHTKALLLSFVGNIFFSLIVWVLRLIFDLTQIICNIVAEVTALAHFFAILLYIIQIIVDLSVLVFINLSQIILSMNSRTNELQADKFAYDIGYGRELTASLYLFQKITISRKARISERIKASHPHLAYRIAQLEKMENEAVA